VEGRDGELIVGHAYLDEGLAGFDAVQLGDRDPVLAAWAYGVPSMCPFRTAIEVTGR
jgi:hypothetical protein